MLALSQPRGTVPFMIFVCAWLSVAGVTGSAPAKNVVLIVTDGLRPQEVFTGASRTLMGREGGVEEEQGLVDKYWRETPQARREALMPFLWKTMARDGQVLGSKVTNPQRVSYPGYHEMLTGFVDPRVDSNRVGPNPNVTVFEWLATKRGFSNRVQAFATWDTFFRIFNVERSKLDVRAGLEPPFEHETLRTPTRDLLDALHRTTTPMFGGNCLDALTVATLKESLRTHRPRVLFLGLGETDEWMHAGRYDLALEAAHRADASIAELWAHLQTLPEYRGTTTFIVTSDHGRGGNQGGAWRDHGAEIAGSDSTFLAAMGPGIEAIGERVEGEPATQSQIASTIAALLGYDWQAESPRAAPSLTLRRAGAPFTAAR